MGTKRPGNWQENAQEVLDKIQNLDSDGDLSGDVSGDLTGRVISAAGAVIVADGAINLNYGLTVLSSGTVSCATTLAAGTAGQRMSIICSVYTNACTVTADFGGAITTATFSAAGEGIDLVYYGAWYVVGNNGAVLS